MSPLRVVCTVIPPLEVLCETIVILYGTFIYNYFIILVMYKRFGKSVQFKKYLHGICDAGSRLLFNVYPPHGLQSSLKKRTDEVRTLEHHLTQLQISSSSTTLNDLLERKVRK